jgi:HSP20 family protein
MNLIRRRGGLYPSFLEDFFDDNWSGSTNWADTGTRVPAVNIREEDDSFEIEVAAPGMQKDDFKINLDNNTLTISAEEKTENEEKDKKGNFTRREFSYSAFRRAFTLPNTVEDEHINANYENGVLKIAIPKKEEARPKPPKQIRIG